MNSRWKVVKIPEYYNDSDKWEALLGGEKLPKKSISPSSILKSNVSRRVEWTFTVGKEVKVRLDILLFRDSYVSDMVETLSNSKLKLPISNSNRLFRYKGSRVHFINEYYMEGGDILKGDGTGHVALEGGKPTDKNENTFPITTHKYLTSEGGLLLLKNNGYGYLGTNFILTFKKGCPQMQGIHQVIGRVLGSGIERLNGLARFGSPSGKPRKAVCLGKTRKLKPRIV